MERTFVMFKPEVLQRGLVGKLITRFEEKGFKIIELELLHLGQLENEGKLREQYAHLQGWPHFYQYLAHMRSGPAILMVLEGRHAVESVRAMIGNTHPEKAAPGTIRFDFGLTDQRNLVHASDSPQEAEVEIERWFQYPSFWYREMDNQLDREWNFFPDDGDEEEEWNEQ